MSTRDLTGTEPPGARPAELQQPPTPTEVPGLITPVPTPGVAMAGARLPGSPSFPDWDPASLTLAMSRMANDLYAPPPIADVSVHPAAPVLPAATPSPANVAGAPTPAPAPEPAANPFFVAPTFDLAAMESGPSAPVELWRFPLVDVADPIGATRSIDAAPPELAPPAAPAPSWPSHELDPFGAEVADLTAQPAARGAFDAHAIRREFPILEERVHGKRLVWLDNAATTQKPRAVIDRVSSFYEHENSNIHRAAHTLAARATEAYEGARETVRRFLNAPSNREIVFVRGATEGINFVAQSWGRRNVKAGDEIVLTWLEHHANIVPWQRLCEETGARLRIAPVDDRGQVILEAYERLLGPATRLVALPQVSNALGTITPARQMVEVAHRHGALVLVDGAQAVSHMRVDVQALDCDFYVFSGHKIFAPTGIGAVFGKAAVLETMPPWQAGGNMIEDVTFEQTRYQPPPMRFEAGTGNIADAVGLGAALDWVTRVGLENIDRHEHDLLVYATDKLRAIPGLTIIGTAAEKAGVISFILAGHKTDEVATYLDKQGIAVRGGHHCAQPILRRFGLESTVRASFAPYNACEDVDELVAALERLVADRGTRSTR